MTTFGTTEQDILAPSVALAYNDIQESYKKVTRVLVDGWSVSPTYRKCGKKGCKTCAEGRGHGPYYYGNRVVDGKRVSRYFGTVSPASDQATTDRALSTELTALREENTRLHALVDELQAKLLDASAAATAEERTKPATTAELTREQVETIWTEASAAVKADPTILTDAHTSLMRGLFPRGDSDMTALRRGNGSRPFVCPFRSSGRGAHRAFASAERLVETAVPWLVESHRKSHERKAQVESDNEARRVEQRRYYEKMPDGQLRDLCKRMETTLRTGKVVGWTLTLDEVREQYGIACEVMKARRM